MTDVANRLHIALRLPRTYRWVSDWLFTNLSAPFHRNLTLPPPHLETAIALHAQHSIALPEDAEHISASQSTKAIDVIFVPVALMDGILVGYMFGLSTPSSDPISVHSNPFEPRFTARFVFDTIHQDMLCVTYGSKPPVIGIMFMGSALGNVREQANFAVPAHEYSFDDLPDTVLSMFCNTEYRVNPPEPQLASPRSPVELIDSLLAPAPIKSNMPWVVSSSGRLADGGMPLTTPVSNDVASGVFSMKSLEEGVASLHDAVAGGFFGPEVETQSLHLLTGRYMSNRTGRIDYLVGKIGGKVVRDAFATSYFCAILDVAPDARLMSEAAGAPAVEWEDAGDEVVELGSVGSGISEEGVGKKRRGPDLEDLVPIAPKYVPSVVVEEKVEAPLNETKEERRERLAVERRKRNRLSAARSNMRKKEELERVKREIEDNWERVKDLKERENLLARENDLLKRLVVGGG